MSCGPADGQGPASTRKITRGGFAACGRGLCVAPSSVLKIITAREGVIVRALTAEMIVEGDGDGNCGRTRR